MNTGYVPLVDGSVCICVCVFVCVFVYVFVYVCSVCFMGMNLSQQSHLSQA